MAPADSSPRQEGARPASGDCPTGATACARTLALLLVLLALALAVRAASASRIFTPEGVRLAADGDPYYHALRAERIADHWPRVSWHDPGMNHPYGAEIPWPPLLDQLIATIVVATGPPGPERIARVAALLPPFLGAAVVAATAALGVALVGRAGWAAAALVALLPAAIRQSFVGRADHHVLEVLLGLIACLALVRGLRRGGPPWRWCALLGGALTLAFWNWSGSALTLLVLAACVAVLHVVSPPASEAAARGALVLAAGSAIAAGLLALSIAAWGPAGALGSLRLTPITGLSVLLSALCAAASAAIALVRRADPEARAARRAAHVLAAIVGSLALLLALPSGQRAGLAHGVTALGASSPWYATIAEFWPLVLSGRQPWTEEVRLAAIAFGLTPVLLVPAAARLAREWRRGASPGPELVFLGVWTLSLVVLALLRRRFEGYAVVPLAVCAAWVAGELVAAVRRRLPLRLSWLSPAMLGAVLLLVLAPGLPLVLAGHVAELPEGADERQPLLAWLRDVRPPPARAGVLAAWPHGHEIQWIARKPVVSTPFGTDIDARSLRDEAAFFTAIDPADARALLERRRVGFLLLENPVREVATMAAFAPGAPLWVLEERGITTGSRYAMREEFFDLLACRLFFFDGGRRAGAGPWLEGYRLLGEQGPAVEVVGFVAHRYKLFGVVPGAAVEVRGARPGATLSAAARIRTNLGRTFVWGAAAVADAEGAGRFALPYATGANGLVAAGPYVVGDGSRAITVSVTEAQVASGEAVRVALGGRAAEPSERR